MSVYCYLKIKNILNHTKKDTHSYEKDKLSKHLELWRPLKRIYLSNKWFIAYSNISGIYDERYVPENLFYSVIQNRLNNQMFNIAFADKNLYDHFYDDKAFPKSILRCINGVMYDPYYRNITFKDDLNLISFIEKFTKIIIKPTVDSSSGNNINLFIREGENYINGKGEKLSLKYLKCSYGNNYILQEYINQHPFFSQFNETSLNSIRMLTYRSVKNEEIHILGVVLRMGKKGSLVDNYTIGGIALAVDNEGIIGNFAYDRFGVKYKMNINKTVEFRNLEKIYRYNDLKNHAISIAKKNYYHRLLAFDLSIDVDDNIRVIEINNSNLEINFFQFHNGSLFKDKTDEIISFCQNNSKSICLDFMVK